MKTIAMIIGILFFVLMLAAVLTANSRWASRMNEYLRKYFYKDEGDHV
jgi:DMSO/TMAO reductase YedYZ heme-binding membrane subunit